jgi:hypothetical protein
MILKDGSRVQRINAALSSAFTQAEDIEVAEIITQ